MTPPAATALQGCRVLVVEDDYMIALDVVDVLRTAGATILGPVGDIAAALALLAADTIGPDLAVLDLDLRGTRSYPVADALAARGIPLLFTTGFSGDAIADPYRHHPRVEKPVSERTLLAAVIGLT